LKQWWAHSRLRTKIFLAFSALILVVLLLTISLTQLVASRQTQNALRRELLATGQVFKGLVNERASRLQTNATLLAGDFALKRVVATYDAKTLTSAALSYQQRIGVDLLWITDEKGVLLADAHGLQQTGRALGNFSPLKEALDMGEPSTTIAVVEDTLFQLIAVPVLGPDVIGFLLLGQNINDRFAEQLEQDTGSHLSFLTPTRLFASSLSSNERDSLFAAEAFSPALFSQHANQEPFLLTFGDEDFLSLVVMIESSLSSPLYVLVQGSYDQAFAPFYVLRRRVMIIGLGALILALFVGVGLAGGITSPVRTLVAGMQEVLKGNLTHRLNVEREDEIGFLARSFNDMVGGLEEREKIRDIMDKVVSPEIAYELLRRGVTLGGEEREATVLFADIRGFTTLSEQLPPPELIQLLNAYLSRMSRVIEEKKGVIDKYIGDEVMAIFGAPLASSDHALRAVMAAVDMLKELQQFNAAEGRNAPLRIGIGIATGPVIAGNVGSPQRLNYTVLGDTVNLASRLQGLTKDYGAPLLISGTTYDQVATKIPCRLLGKSTVRGRQEETLLYTVAS
jgi:adenylate cyclase